MAASLRPADSSALHAARRSSDDTGEGFSGRESIQTLHRDGFDGCQGYGTGCGRGHGASCAGKRYGNRRTSSASTQTSWGFPQCFDVVEVWPEFKAQFLCADAGSDIRDSGPGYENKHSLASVGDLRVTSIDAAYTRGLSDVMGIVWDSAIDGEIGPKCYYIGGDGNRSGASGKDDTSDGDDEGSSFDGCAESDGVGADATPSSSRGELHAVAEGSPREEEEGVPAGVAVRCASVEADTAAYVRALNECCVQGQGSFDI